MSDVNEVSARFYLEAMMKFNGDKFLGWSKLALFLWYSPNKLFSLSLFCKLYCMFSDPFVGDIKAQLKYENNCNIW